MKRKHEISENQQRTGATKLFSMDATLNELGDEHNNRSVKHTNREKERKNKLLIDFQRIMLTIEKNIENYWRTK